MAIGVGHQLVGFLGRRKQALRVVDIIMHQKGHGDIGAVDTGGAGINQMLNTVVTTTFEDMAKPNQVAVNLRQRVFKGITHTGLCCEIQDVLEFVGFK